jgi:hypothetical protein
LNDPLEPVEINPVLEINTVRVRELALRQGNSHDQPGGRSSAASAWNSAIWRSASSASIA